VKALRRIGIVLLSLILVLGVLAGGTYMWARSATDMSLVARGIMWGDSDVGDVHRFPSRTVHASSEPVRFRARTPDWLSELRLTPNDAIGEVAFEDWLEATNTTAFVILHGDDLLYEGYFNGSSREDIHHAFSVAKSFASTLVGIAIEEGTIASLDDAVTDYIPELLERDPRFGDITIRHLITMVSGLRFRRTSNPLHDGTKTYYAPDLRALALSSEIEEPAGARFSYNDYNPLLIGMVLERATGMSVSEYMETRLWQPMGAEFNASWSLDSNDSGFENLSAGFNARAIDLAKLGWLFLNKGRNGDRQVVPAEWVEEATRVDTTTDPAAKYQYYWWTDEERNGYYAEGDKCHFIYVYPDADLVITRTGINCSNGHSGSFYGLIAEWMAQQITESTL
jgi:CubicO group peptidase (beta-lactamase class C family)